MAENEEGVTVNNPSTNTRNELSRRTFYTSVEFPMFMFMVSLALSGVAISNIILYRTCIHSLNHSEVECRIFLSLEKNNMTQALEKEVQKYATFISTVKSIIESIAPAILSMFLGVWSDTYGRKPLIVWPIFGTSMTSILMVVYAMSHNLGPWWYILTVIPYSLTGGITILYTGMYCYLTDITTDDQRSLRMTVMQAVASVGIVIGSLTSSYIIKAVGNVNLLLISASLNVTGYVYSSVWLRESLTGAVQGGLSSIIDIVHVKEMLRECFKSRPNKGRAQILLLTIANSLSVFMIYGVMNLDYYYTRTKLQWTLKDYTVYSSVATMISFAGSFFGIAVVQRLLGISDLAFSNIALISAATDCIIKTLAVNSWYMYFGATVSLFKGLSSPLIRSLITKILPIQEIATVFALMSALEGMCPLIAPLLYNSLYELTISNLPAAIYILSTGITLLCIILVGLVQYFRWNISSTYERLEP